MSRIADLSLRSKLVLVMTATTFVALALAFGVLLIFDRFESRAELRRQLDSMAEVVGSSSTAALVFDDTKAGEENLAALRVHPSVVAAGLYTKAGRRFAAYERGRGSPRPIPERPGPDGFRLDDGRIRLFRQISYRNDAIGTVFIEAETSELTARQLRFGFVVLFLAFAGGATALLAAARFQALISQPVLRLAGAAKSVAEAKDYTVRVPRASRDEIGDLTDAFNGMLAEIQARDEALRTAQDALREQVRDLEQEMAERKQAQEALRQSEAQLRQAQKMEAVGTLAGGVAHDFNNLLQAMLAQTQLLRLGPMSPEAIARATSELEQQAMRGASLTRQLLIFSRRETSKLEDVDLNGVVREAARMLGRLVRANVTFAIELADGALHVEADHGQLIQVIMNLALNGADAMPDGGRLTLRTGEDQAGGVLLEVRDTGTGIPEEIRDRIFEPFFTTKSETQGTGLGLSVVHGIVTVLGGRIGVESREGVGTVFRVSLPRKSVATAASAPAPGDDGRIPVGGHGERILVVEDEAGAREALKELLTVLGYSVTAVGTGEAAGLLPMEPGFDLLLTDVMLPGLSGADLANGLHDRWPELKVILMSGYSDDESVRRLVAGGTVRFLQKPFDMTTLAAELAAALSE